MENDTLIEIAQRYRKSVPQLILRWHIQNGVIPVSKSTNLRHIRSNLNIDNFTISEEDMKRIESLDRSLSFDRTPELFRRIMYRVMR